MADHRTLSSGNVHEPKHISDSTSADAGKVITPLSGGDSELRNLTPSEVGIQFIYGEAAVDANTTAFSVTAASDTDLYTTGDYVQLNETRIPSMYLDHANGVSFDETTNALEVPLDGDYRISFWCNVISDTSNTKIGFKSKLNGDWANYTVKHDISNTDRVQLVAGSLITDLNANDTISMYIASDKSADITISDMRFYVELLREV